MMNHVDAIIVGCTIAFFGILATGFLALIWRRLDSIDRTLALVQGDLKQFYGDQKKLEGRVDEISARVK